MLIGDCVTRGKLEIGSAVLIRIGDRLFAATAKHCIGDAPYFVFGDKFSLPAKPTKFLKCVSHASMDIGFVELPADITPHGCSIENLDTSPPVLPTDPRSPQPPFYYVVGYPWEERTQVGDTMAMWVSSFGTLPIKVQNDLYQFTYPLKYVQFENGTPVEHDMPAHPKGFSGGGVWRFVPQEPGKLYVPSNHIKLHGIVYSWGGSYSRQVNAVTISCWLQFLYGYYPDLQSLLAAKFPFLAAPASRATHASAPG